VWGNNIYIFTNHDELIAILPLPSEYKSAVDKILKRNREKG